MHWLMAILLALPWWKMEGAARLEQWKNSTQEATPQRLLQTSAGFLGTPYAFSPLGEGEGVDADPLFSWEKVDCLTFVEETMALSLAQSWEEVLGLLNDIRYAEGKPSYEARNHHMEAQWLPHNLQKGYLKSLAGLWPQEEVQQAPKVLTQETWAHAEGRALKLAQEARPLGHFSVEMVPVAQALPLLGKLPEGSLLVFIQADLPKRITRIRHLGFVVQGEAGPLLRHASRSLKKVVDEPLERYIRRNLAYASWTIEGVGVYEIQKPPKAEFEEAEFEEHICKPPATQSAGP